jgi:hypothetical protein
MPKSKAPTAMNAGEADRLEHDIPKAGDFIALDDFSRRSACLAPASLDCNAGLKRSSDVTTCGCSHRRLALVLPAAAQQRDRASIPEQYKVGPHAHLSVERRLARGEGQARR